MGMIGTFDAFTTARLGIYAAQHGLRVTGNNISNLSTSGYTRQRIEQESLKTGGADMYRSPYDNHVGNGSLVTGINQIRDPYLDITYRTTNSKVGYTDTWLSGMNEIAQTLDEVGRGKETNKTDEGDGILYAQLRDLRDMLMQLQGDPNKDNDTLVRNSAETLCQLFNSYGKNLEELRKEKDAHFQSELASVNEILSNIRDLNETIRNAEIVGDNALELRDERNRQLDSLSEYMHIKVEYTMEDIGGGKQVEKLTVSLGNSNPDPKVHTDETILVDGAYGSQILCENEDYILSVSNLVDSKNVLPQNHNQVNLGRPVTLADNDLYGSFQALRELLTEKGEFSTQADVDRDPNATTKRGIPYYQKSLDLLARQFAEAFNALNQGVLTGEGGNALIEGAGPLFSNRNDGDKTDNITASNISVSHSWSTGDVKVVPTFDELFGGTITDSTQNVNINHMISKIDQSLVYNPKDLVPDAVSSKLFEGSFNDMFSNMNGVLANSQRITDVQLNNNYSELVDIDTRRDGVSGVDLNDEAMNIMQFQKAYSAACRFMTAIDEVLERLINNTGVAGR